MNRFLIIIGLASIVFSFFMLLTPWEWSSSSSEVTFPYGVKYEVFVQSYADSDGDGIGDIVGLTNKLDYIESLGVNGIWLMPIMPSPSYHKYDVTDYYNIHPDYGTLGEVERFVQEAHKRDIRIIIDMVINHTSTQHPWFLQAAFGPNNTFHDYYVWEKTRALKNRKSTIKKSQDSDNLKKWHQLQRAGLKNDSLKDSRYYGFFWGGMPDLNFDNEQVKKEMIAIAKFWLQDMNVDGFRLDAARHIFPENRASDNHKFWQWYRSELMKIKPDVYLVGEVWEEAQHAIPYVQGLPSMFNFDLSKAIIDVVKHEKDTLELIKNYIDIQQLYTTSNSQFLDATFLTNHDQDRVRSVLGGDIEKTKLAARILLTLPGIPFLYYGEEIGMLGKKPDEHIREPFLWDLHNSVNEQTTWINPLYSNASSVTVLSKQQENPNSIWNTYKECIEVRNSTPAITYGGIIDYFVGSSSLVAWECTYEEENVLVVHNLSSEAQSMDMLFREGVFYEKLYASSPDIEVQGTKLRLTPLGSVVLNMKRND